MRHYFHAFILKGLHSLVYKRPPGRPPRLTKTQRKELAALIESGPEPYPLDFRLLGFLSLLPLGAGVVGMLKRPGQRQPATRLVNGILVTLTGFLALADGYLVYLAARL